jgi:histidyl-tRNA synthetase
LRYYTGLVFEIYAETPDGPLQVCGGGRYDDLVRALGGREPVPACGFSYGLERVALASSSVEPVPAGRVLVLGVTPADHPEALGLAAALRDAGFSVEQDVRLRGVKAALRYADRAAIDLVAIVGERERADNQVVLRNMHTRVERSIAQADLVAGAQAELAQA